jgi:hypothetical protein
VATVELSDNEQYLIDTALGRYVEWLETDINRNPNRFVVERLNEVYALRDKVSCSSANPA